MKLIKNIFIVLTTIIGIISIFGIWKRYNTEKERKQNIQKTAEKYLDHTNQNIKKSPYLTYLKDSLLKKTQGKIKNPFFNQNIKYLIDNDSKKFFYNNFIEKIADDIEQPASDIYITSYNNRDIINTFTDLLHSLVQFNKLNIFIGSKFYDSTREKVQNIEWIEFKLSSKKSIKALNFPFWKKKNKPGTFDNYMFYLSNLTEKSNQKYDIVLKTNFGDFNITEDVEHFEYKKFNDSVAYAWLDQYSDLWLIPI